MTKYKIDKFLVELENLCRTYNVGLVATCESEQISGELHFIDLLDKQQCEMIAGYNPRGYGFNLRPHLSCNKDNKYNVLGYYIDYA